MSLCQVLTGKAWRRVGEDERIMEIGGRGGKKGVNGRKEQEEERSGGERDGPSWRNEEE